MFKNFDDLGFKDGDVVRCIKSDTFGIDAGDTFIVEDSPYGLTVYTDSSGTSSGIGAEWESVDKVKGLPKVDDKPTGGPESYYDFPPEWKTLNDYIEYKSINQWLAYSFHLANITKATCRWGIKKGVSMEYDARKIIYSGCRILKMLIGTEGLRKYLREILDDNQFK